MTERVLEFALDHPTSQVAFTYSPWQTRTLKLKMMTQKTMPPLRVRPQRMKPEDRQAQIFRAFADQSEAFIVSWGGGHEVGPCVQAQDFMIAFEQPAPLPANANSWVFFNLTHVGPDIPDTTPLTFEAFEEGSGKVHARLTVVLTKPVSMPKATDIMQLKSADQRVWRLEGKFLSTYDPRWWPETLAYVSAPSYPLTVERHGGQLRVLWQGSLVATITDQTTPTVLDDGRLDFDLFEFDQTHIALRVWFFWWDKKMGHGFFVGRHEIPDAERFDLLIHKTNGRINLACTDMHWRESWGETTEPVLKAIIGLNSEAKMHMATEKLDALWQKWWGQTSKEHERPYNPMVYINRLAELLGLGRHLETRAKGTEAHVPLIENVVQHIEPNHAPPMTSSDVRLG